jgi:hypothetical protein
MNWEKLKSNADWYMRLPAREYDRWHLVRRLAIRYLLLPLAPSAVFASGACSQ